MDHDDSHSAYAQLFSLPSEHRLTLSSSRKVNQNGSVYETRWLEEYDEKNHVVARFRTWSKQSQQPPYKKQLGWERFSVTGKLLDREVRYSKRATDDYLH